MEERRAKRGEVESSNLRFIFLTFLSKKRVKQIARLPDRLKNYDRKN